MYTFDTHAVYTIQMSILYARAKKHKTIFLYCND